MRCGCRRYWRQTVGCGDCCCQGNGPRRCGECADVCECECGWRMASPGQREGGRNRRKKNEREKRKKGKKRKTEATIKRGMELE